MLDALMEIIGQIILEGPADIARKKVEEKHGKGCLSKLAYTVVFALMFVFLLALIALAFYLGIPLFT